MPWKYLSRVQPAVINNLTNVWYTYGISIYISGATVYSSLATSFYIVFLLAGKLGNKNK